MARSKFINTFDTTAEYETYIESALPEFPNVAYDKQLDKVNIVRTSPNNHLFYAELVDATQNIPEIQLNYVANTPTVDTLTNMCYLDNWSTTTPDYFYIDNNTNLKSVKKWKGLDTSSVTSMEYMFNGCSALTSLDLSGWDTSSVTSMTSMFEGCSSLTSLDLSNFDTSNVTTMYQMFYSCTALTSLDLSNFDTSSVTTMEGLFSGCSSLTSLDLSNWDTSNVTNMFQMFNGCSALTSLDLSNFDTSSVTNMNIMFDGCTALTSLDLSNWDTSNVTNMVQMFNGCNALTDVYITEEVTLNKLTNNLSSEGYDYIPSNNGNCTIHYNGTDYKWQNNAWTPQS